MCIVNSLGGASIIAALIWQLSFGLDHIPRDKMRASIYMQTTDIHMDKCVAISWLFSSIYWRIIPISRCVCIYVRLSDWHWLEYLRPWWNKGLPIEKQEFEISHLYGNTYMYTCVRVANMFVCARACMRVQINQNLDLISTELNHHISYNVMYVERKNHHQVASDADLWCFFWCYPKVLNK